MCTPYSVRILYRTFILFLFIYLLFILIPIFKEKYILPAGSVPPLYHLTSCTPTKSNLHFAVCLATVIGEPAL
jgi:hypothetical protein